MPKYKVINILFFIFLIGFIILYYNGVMDLNAGISLIILYSLIFVLSSLNIDSNLYLNAVCTLNTNEKKVALTFDDGPSPEHTDRILDSLKKHDVKACFFIIGNHVLGNEAILKRIREEGHCIGNHSDAHHISLTYSSSDKVLKDMRLASEKIESVVKEPLRLYRPPYGVTNPNIAKVVEENKMIPVGWDVRSFDTFYNNAKMISNRMLKNIREGSILLFHDSEDVTAEVLDILIPALKERNYAFTNLEHELLK